jgi:hypothetical protein
MTAQELKHMTKIEAKSYEGKQGAAAIAIVHAMASAYPDLSPDQIEAVLQAGHAALEEIDIANAVEGHRSSLREYASDLAEIAKQVLAERTRLHAVDHGPSAVQ